MLDQTLKFWVKLNMEYGGELSLFGLSWAKLHFVENKGMAFGLSLGGDYGKLALSLVRIIAIGFLVYFIKQFILKKAPLFLLVCFSLILAGAIGNILDSAFYGLIFSNSSYHGGVASLFPEGGGYAPFLYGKVVDMFYFPMFRGHFPGWFPIWGNEPFLFFRPVFNLADVAITIGVLSILLFQRNIFSTSLKDMVVDEDEKGQDEKAAENLQANPISNERENNLEQ